MTSEPKAKSTHSRFEVLDGMRGVAAILVMFHHYLQFDGESQLLSNGNLGVDLFFMLSGFVIVHSYGKRLQQGMSLLDYTAKRLIRLYPMFILGIVIGTPILYWLQAGPPGSIGLSVLCNIFYLPYINNFSTYVFPVNPPAWSLFFEIIASMAFLVLYRLGPANLFKVVAGSFVLYLICGFLHFSTDHRYTFMSSLGWGSDNLYGGFPRVIYGFSFGVLIYAMASAPRLHVVRDWVERHVKFPAQIYVALIILFLFPAQWRGLYQIFFLLCAAPALVYIGSIVRCSSPLSLKAAQFLGWISYPLYCVHFPIGSAVFAMAARAHHAPIYAFGASILLSLSVASLVTWLYDEPVRAYLSRQLSKHFGSSRSAQKAALDSAPVR